MGVWGQRASILKTAEKYSSEEGDLEDVVSLLIMMDTFVDPVGSDFRAAVVNIDDCSKCCSQVIYDLIILKVSAVSLAGGRCQQ